MYFIEHFRVIGNHIEQVPLRFRVLLGSLTVHTISLFGRGGNVLVGLPYIDGTELDYVKEGLQEGFKYNNPQEKERCGCGKSFHV